jgi:hypothetical protein
LPLSHHRHNPGNPSPSHFRSPSPVTFQQPLTVIPAKAGIHDAANTPAAIPET